MNVSEQTLTPQIVPKDPAAGVVLEPDALRNPEPDQNDSSLAGTEAGGDASASGGVDAEETAQAELAKSRGWVAEKDWKGKGKWVSASEYNERHETLLPHLARENRTLRERERERDARLQAAEAEIAEFRKFRDEQAEARTKIEHQTLLSQRAQAIENNDTQRIVEIDDQLMDLKVQAKTAPKPQQKQANQVDPNVKRILDDFLEENPMFKDPDMQEALNEAAVLMRASGSQLQNRDFLEKAKGKVQRWYPDKFTTPRRPAMAEMSGSPSSAASNAKRSWNSLKPDAREALDSFIANSVVHQKMGLEKARASVLANADDSYFRK